MINLESKRENFESMHLKNILKYVEAELIIKQHMRNKRNQGHKVVRLQKNN